MLRSVVPFVVRRIAHMTERIQMAGGKRHDGKERSAHDRESFVFQFVRHIDKRHFRHFVFQRDQRDV